MVPGVEVAQIGASEWAISIRGFNNRYRQQTAGADRRTQRIHAAEFSGVYWGPQDTVFLEDVESIEVVRGPGA